MEDERRNKHGKRKMNIPLKSLTIGGEGGITGLLVFGGALAVAGFMAVTSFVTKKNTKAKRIHHHHHDQDTCNSEQDYQETTQTHLNSLQHSATQDVTCCWTFQKSINQEEKIDPNKPDRVEESPTCFKHQEVEFPDYSHPESAELSKKKGFVEEKEEPQDLRTFTETEDDEDYDDDDVDMKSDDVTKTDEEDRLKTTGTTFLDYNEEQISWTTVPKEANFSVVSNEHPSILTTWVMPVLFFALISFLVLLTHGLREYLYVLDDGDSVIV